GRKKINEFPGVAFADEVMEALAPVLAEITYDDQPNAIVGEFLKDFSSQTSLQIKKIDREVFLVENDFIKPLVVNVPDQVDAIFGVVNHHMVCYYFHNPRVPNCLEFHI